MARRPLSKKIRFEVFKRDSFRCQYCGAEAPNVVLHVDHIKAVVDGGSNELTNLITSCIDCNLGKGPRPLDEQTEVAKQRRMLEELNERRLQLEMIMEWREGLRSHKEDAAQLLIDAISRASGFIPQEDGRREITRWLRKYGFAELLDAIEISFEQYGEYDADDKMTSKSWSKAFDYVPRIASVRKRSADDPDLSRAFYIRGILRNRLPYVNEREALEIINAVRSWGCPMERIIGAARDCGSWSNFRNRCLDLIDEYRDDQDV